MVAAPIVIAGEASHARASRLHEALLYVLAALAALVIAFVLFRLWGADVRVPATYDGDGLFVSATVKGTIENGWYLDNPSLGAPGVQDLRDYPIADNLELATMKVLSVISPDYAVVLNLFVLLMYPMTAVCALWAMRRLGISTLPAFVASMLYAFVPYAVLRVSMYGQVSLTSYFLVPLVAWIAVENVDRPFLVLPRRGEGWSGGWRRPLFTALVCVLIASNGIYYAFFAVVVLAGSGISGAARHRTWRPLTSVALLSALILLVTLANLAPSILYQRANGPNPEVAQRSPIEAEIMGLKIDQMLLPVQEHRIGFLRHVKSFYLANLAVWSPWATQTENVSLGLIGSVGLLVLIGWLLFVRGGRLVLGKHRDWIMGRISVIDGFALFVATYAGLGVAIAAVFPRVRVYGRMFVYVAFFCFVAVAVLLERLGDRPRRTRLGAAAFAAALVILLALGLLDQVPPGILPKYAANKVRWDSDAGITARIEKVLPSGSMVFTLPYMPYPESPPPYPGTMNDYDQLRGYLHSTHLQWSYAAMKGRSTDLWQRAVAAMVIPDMVSALRAKGFDGIWLDRDGYADRGAQEERALRAELGTAPLVSDDGRIVFFQL